MSETRQNSPAGASYERPNQGFNYMKNRMFSSRPLASIRFFPSNSLSAGKFLACRCAPQLRRRPHPGLFDEALGGGVDRAPFAAPRRVDIERPAVRSSGRGRVRQRYLIGHRQSVVGEQQFRAINPVEQKQTPGEIGLAAHQMPGDDPYRVEHPPPAEMLAIEGTLSGHQLLIELG